MIGHEEKLSAGFERVADRLQKIFIHESPAMVAEFWPRVGAKQVKARDGVLRQQPLDDIAAFKSQHSCVVETSARNFFADLAHAAEQAFDAEKVAVVMMAGHFHQERPIAAAEINFERPAIAKDFRRGDFAEVMFRHKFARHRCPRQLVQHLLHDRDFLFVSDLFASPPSKIGIGMNAGDRIGRAHDAAREVRAARNFCIRPNDRVAHDRAGFDNRAGPDHRVDDGGTVFDHCVGVHARSQLKLAVRAEVRFAITEIEPHAFVERDGAELVLFGELEEEWDHRNFFIRRNLVDEFRVHAIDAAEDMGACGASEFFVNVDDSAACGVERDVSGGALRAQRERDWQPGGFVSGDQRVEWHGRKDVAVVDEQR